MVYWIHVLYAIVLYLYTETIAQLLVECIACIIRQGAALCMLIIRQELTRSESHIVVCCS